MITNGTFRTLPCTVIAAALLVACSDGGGKTDAGGDEGTTDTPDAPPDVSPDADGEDGVTEEVADPADAPDMPDDGWIYDGEFEPNPTFEGLADNTAVDLGPTNLAGPEGESYDADAVTDYSGFTYDPNHHLMLMFGGGHATTYTDSVYAFRFDTLAWEPLYPPTPASLMVCSNFSNDLGGWLSGPAGPYPRPAARHTYDMLVVPAGIPEFLVLRMGDGGNEQVDTCEYYWGGVSFPVYGVETVAWEFVQEHAWGGGFGEEAAEFDPPSGLVVMLGSYGLYTYDPAGRASVQALTQDQIGEDLGYANHLVYYPPTQKMYYFNRNAGNVWELTLDRTDFSRSAVAVLATTGPYPPHGEPGFDYDASSGIIGGAVTDGVFYAFDPATLTWTAETILGGSPGSQSFHALAYDPVDNVFIFITDDRRTWAYRYRQ